MSKTKPTKPSAELDQTANPNTPDAHHDAPEMQSHWLLKSSNASKVSKYGKGEVNYQVTSDMDRRDLHIQITGNAGGGYFSREKVPFHAIEACLAGMDAHQPFPSSAFKQAFSGRSSNNSGFMVAILRAEGLISATSAPGIKYEKSGDWNAWKQTLLAEPGSLITEPRPQEQLPSSVSSSSSSRGTLRLPKKKATTKDEAS